MIKLVYDLDTLVYKGFYKEGIHKNIPSNHINIDSELYNYLMKLDEFKVNNDVQLSKETLYTIENKDMFTVEQQEPLKPKPSQVDLLNAQFMMEVAHKDLQIKDLETQQAQSLLESAKKDIEIKQLQEDVASLLLELATIKGGN